MATRHTDAPPGAAPRVLTLARVVALTLILLAVAGIGFLRLSSASDDPVAVPEGAGAGDLTLQPCEYDGEAGPRAADCGSLVVPEDRADDSSRLIALPVVRVRAETGDPREPVFFLTGGPGQSNMDFALADRYTAERDVVLVGFRGIDGSVRLDCPEVDSAFKRSADLLDDASFAAYRDAYRSCADRLAATGIEPGRYGLVDQVDDMETARIALGYGRIDLLSESAGTRTAMVYAWRHPGSIRRSVMFGVNPPGAFLQDEGATAEQIERFASLCAADPDCSARTADLAATMAALSRDVPDRWMFLTVKEGNVRAMALLGLLEPSSGPFTAPMMIDAWLAAAEGDAGGLWVSSLLGDLLPPDMFVRGQYAAAAMLDAQAARDYFADGPGDLSDLARASSAFAWGGGTLAEAWPPVPEADRYDEVKPSRVETLLVGGELDVATPPQVATGGLLPSLPNGQEVVLPGIGHTGSFFADQPQAGTRLILSFLDSGRADDSGYAPQRMDFTPPTTYGTVAKVLVGTMLGLAAFTVLSLAVLTRRARSQDRVGPTAAALLRTVHASVVGLGGWCLGALVVLAALPTVRFDNALLVVTCTGTPVALAVHLTTASGVPPRTRWMRVVAVLAGALLGAWAGLQAAVLPMALLVAVVGAVAGANLTAILLDVWRDAAVRGRVAASIPGRPGSASERVAPTAGTAASS